MIFLGRIVICLALLSAIARGQEDWVKQSPPPLLSGVVQLDSMTTVAVGNDYESFGWWYPEEHGVILRSSDGGDTWTRVLEGLSTRLNAVGFRDALVGTAVGNGLTFRTTDGGRSWLEQISPSGVNLTAVRYLDADVGVIVGDGTILQTTDGGVSWTNRSQGTPNQLVSVALADSATGTAVGEHGTILRTSDGGRTWSNQGPAGPFYLRQVAHLGPRNAVAIGGRFDPRNPWIRDIGGAVFRTTDGGLTWQDRSPGIPLTPSGMHFLNPDTGVIVGGGLIARTTDGGLSWSDHEGSTVRRLSAVRSANPLIGWAVGERGTILKTTDGGLTWRHQLSRTSVDLVSLACDGPDRVIVAGSSPSTLILRSTDGGETWTETSAFGASSISSLIMMGESMVVGAGCRTAADGADIGCVVRSVDGGATWTSIDVPGLTEARDVAFSDASHGLTVGHRYDSNGVPQTAVARTTDGGMTWSGSTLPIRGNLSSITSAGAGMYVAVGRSIDSTSQNHPLILRSTDGGASWTESSVDLAGDLLQVSFATPDSGWVLVGFAGGTTPVLKLLATSDGGSTWNVHVTPVVSNSGRFEDLSGGVLLMVGENGQIYRSTDAGRSWNDRSKPHLRHLRSVAFATSTLGFAVGGQTSPVLLRTTDGGTTWTQRPVSWAGPLNAIAAIDDQTVVMAATLIDTYGNVLELRVHLSTDAGETWTTRGPCPSARLSDLHLVDRQTWDVVAASDGIWLRTTDAGATWNQRYMYSGIASWFFVGPLHGVAVGGGGTILRTTDGGTTWTRPAKLVRSALNDVSPAGPRIAVAVGEDSLILRSTDGGDTWAPVPAGITGSVRGICFTDANHGHAVGQHNAGWNRGLLLRSSDGGQTWSPHVIDTISSLERVAFSDTSHGIVLGMPPTFLRTSDGGATWQAMQGPDISPLSDVSMWGRIATVVGREILQSPDGGDTWESRLATTRNLNDIFLLDARSGLAVGALGLILRTSNGGMSWSSVRSGTTLEIRSVQYLTSSDAIVSGDNGLVLRSTDAGMSWSPRIIGARGRVARVSFIDSHLGLAVGDSGFIAQSTDGGNEWDARSVGDSVTLVDVDWLDENEAVAVGSVRSMSAQSAVLFRTSDRGTTWIVSAFDTLQELVSVSFCDRLHGMIAGRAGWRAFVVLSTSDGGASWQTSPAPITTSQRIYLRGPSSAYLIGVNRFGIGAHSSSYTQLQLSTDGGVTWNPQYEEYGGWTLDGIHFAGDSLGVAVGYGGLILRTTNGGTTWVGDGPDGPAIPRASGLEQNYPNPFNGQTVVGYRVLGTGSRFPSPVSLRVYDLLGREVATLVEEVKPPGSYTVTWETYELPSGIYFCRMSAGGVVETKKMILVR